MIAKQYNTRLYNKARTESRVVVGVSVLQTGAIKARIPKGTAVVDDFKTTFAQKDYTISVRRITPGSAELQQPAVIKWAANCGRSCNLRDVYFTEGTEHMVEWALMSDIYYGEPT